MMKTAIMVLAFLVILNAVVYLWPKQNQLAPHIYAEQSDINTENITVFKERLGNEVAAIHEEQAAGDALFNLPLQRNQSDVQSGEQVLNRSCYRLGPFKVERNYHLAQQKLDREKINYNLMLKDARRAEVFRVYVGPFDNKFQAADIMKKLRGKSIKDYFVRNNKAQKIEISLGIFSSESAANRALTVLSDKVEGIKKRKEGIVLPKTYWVLIYDLKERDKVKLSGQVWGENAVTLGEFSCGQPN